MPGDCPEFWTYVRKNWTFEKTIEVQRERLTEALREEG